MYDKTITLETIRKLNESIILEAFFNILQSKLSFKYEILSNITDFDAIFFTFF